jgi:hypothetical protein
MVKYVFSPARACMRPRPTAWLVWPTALPGEMRDVKEDPIMA